MLVPLNFPGSLVDARKTSCSQHPGCYVGLPRSICVFVGEKILCLGTRRKAVLRYVMSKYVFVFVSSTLAQ